MKAYPARRAFTLVEVVVSLGLATIFLSMAFGISNRAARVWERRQQTMLASRAAWSFMDRLSRELRATVAPERYGADARLVGQEGESTLRQSLPKDRIHPAAEDELAAAKLGDDTLRFAALPPGETRAPHVIEYRVKRSPEEDAVGIVRRWAPLGEDVSESAGTLAAQQVVSLKLDYMAEDGSWQGEWVERDDLPRAVRMTVAAVVPSVGLVPDMASFSTVVYLPVGGRIDR